MNMNKNRNKFGFKIPVITPDNYVLGASAVPRVVLREDGNWNDFLPEAELQNKRSLETYDCTGFATLNAIETLQLYLFNEKVNYSDRWVGIIAGTTEGGNDPHIVAEAIRKFGLIPEEMLPFSDDLATIDEYYSFKGADKEACYRAGKEWLERNDFKHEWVFLPEQSVEEKIKALKYTLKLSPLGISVLAWNRNSKGIYAGNGVPNHWTLEYAFPDNLQRIFDSYDPFKKLVEQSILFAKRYWIAKKPPVILKPKTSSCFLKVFSNLLSG